MKSSDLRAYLSANAYPGRGILMGRSPNGKAAVIAYFIMGRSENSRNRLFLETPDGIRTEAFDPAKITDPSLIIYHPVRVYDGRTIVTNGDQTDTIRSAIAAGASFAQGLLSRTFEPDGPNYTPRISGLMEADGAYQLSILKSLQGDPSCCCRYFFSYDSPRAGLGHLIHTYRGDGEPLPSFEGEPVPVDLKANHAGSLADFLWESMDRENRVSLFVRYIPLAGGETETAILNKNQ